MRFLLSAHASHEELFLFRRLTEELLGRRRRRRDHASAGASRRKPQPAAHDVQGAAGRRAERQRRAAVRPGRRRRRRRRAARRTSRRCAQAVEAGQVSALYVFDPGPGRLARRHRTGSSTRAQRGTLPLLDRPGRAADRAGARRRFRAAGRIVRREGSVLYERPGPAAGHVARDSAAGRRDGRLADSRRTSAPRSACRSTTRAPAHVRADIAGALPGRARSSQGLPTLAFGRPVDGAALAAGVEPVGALEVGFHVPGSAAGERHRRSVGAAAAAGRDPAERSEVECRRHEAQMDTKALRFAPSLCRVAVAVPSRVVRAQAQPAAQADVDAARRARRRPRRRRPSRVALQVSLPEGLHTQSNKPRDPTADSDRADDRRARRASRSTEIVFPPPTDLKQAGARSAARGLRARRSRSACSSTVARSVAPGDVDGAGARCATRPATTTMCYRAGDRRRRSGRSRVVRRGDGRPAARRDVFDAIAFGTRRRRRRRGRAAPAPRAGAAPPIRRPPTMASRRSTTSPSLGTTGGYLGSDDFLQFIHNAENGVEGTRACSRAAGRWRSCCSCSSAASR